jgi:hypothetical protein
LPPQQLQTCAHGIEFQDINPTQRFLILLDKVVDLGNLGEIVKVNDGYAWDNRWACMTVTNHDISAELAKQGFPALKPQIRMPSVRLKIVPTMLKRWAECCMKKLSTRSKPHDSCKSREVTHDFREHFHPISTAYPQLCPAWFAKT